MDNKSSDNDNSCAPQNGRKGGDVFIPLRANAQDKHRMNTHYNGILGLFIIRFSLKKIATKQRQDASVGQRSHNLQQKCCAI